MLSLPEEAIGKFSHIPNDKQYAIASLILDAIADEDRWDLAFAKSQDKLSKIAARVRQDIKTGRAKKLVIDEL